MAGLSILKRAARQNLGGAMASERTVRSDIVVVMAPGRDQLLGKAQAGEYLLVEALVAQAPVAALGHAFFDMLARADEV